MDPKFANPAIYARPIPQNMLSALSSQTFITTSNLLTVHKWPMLFNVNPFVDHMKADFAYLANIYKLV